MASGVRGFLDGLQAARSQAAVAAWARRRGHACKREQSGRGFVIDGRLEDHGWRLEWGPSQRPYIAGQELRARIDLGLPRDLDLLVMSRPLMEHLERLAYEDYTRSNQTVFGNATPEEARWLVMLAKFDMPGSAVLGDRFGGVAGSAKEGVRWLDGSLGHALERAASTLLAGQPTFVLMTPGTSVLLRMGLDRADEAAIATALELFETAGTEALRVAAARG